MLVQKYSILATSKGRERTAELLTKRLPALSVTW